VVFTVFEKGQIRVVITVVKNGQFRMVNTVIKKLQFKGGYYGGLKGAVEGG